jgi:hypothetical protein
MVYPVAAGLSEQEQPAHWKNRRKRASQNTTSSATDHTFAFSPKGNKKLRTKKKHDP